MPVWLEIKDLSPPHDITQAMNKQMKAEREKRSDILIAEGHKQSSILKAEGEKEAAIREAEGRKEAAYLDAEGREREAQAEAKATEMVSTAIARGDVNAINYFVAQEYVKAFGELAKSPNQKTVIVPAELSGLAATVGGHRSGWVGTGHRNDLYLMACHCRLGDGGSGL